VGARMTWEFIIWGATGGLAVELVEFYGAIRRVGNWPWNLPGEPRRSVLLVAVVIRIILGAILAGALGASEEVSGAMGALAAGVAAPLLVEQLKRLPGHPVQTSPELEPGGAPGTSLDSMPRDPSAPPERST
jgi:hypothetical protein